MISVLSSNSEILKTLVGSLLVVSIIIFAAKIIRDNMDAQARLERMLDESKYDHYKAVQVCLERDAKSAMKKKRSEEARRKAKCRRCRCCRRWRRR